jgi:hypothetical protein
LNRVALDLAGLTLVNPHVIFLYVERKTRYTSVRKHSSEERGMPESKKRSFWDRLFSTDRTSQREERVLEYIMHRVGEGAHLGDIVNEEYVRRNASREEVEEICARPELVQTAREHLKEDFGSGDLDPTKRRR